MRILTERETWRREPPKTPKRTVAAFDGSQRDNLRRAARFLVRRFGNIAALAAAMGVSYSTLSHVFMRRRAVSATTALRIARLAHAALDDVLSGRWPREGACPCCGRGPTRRARSTSGA
jgi:AraC-like DNA-binding protein